MGFSVGLLLWVAINVPRYVSWPWLLSRCCCCCWVLCPPAALGGYITNVLGYVILPWLASCCCCCCCCCVLQQNTLCGLKTSPSTRSVICTVVAGSCCDQRVVHCRRLHCDSWVFMYTREWVNVAVCTVIAGSLCTPESGSMSQFARR